MKVALAADHAGFHLKEELKHYVAELGHDTEDFGAHELNPKDDYPDFVIPAARAVADGRADRAIIIGSGGQGEAIAANRIKGARAMVYYGSAAPLKSNSKVGKLRGLIHEGREDNDTNVLSLAASFVSQDEAKKVVEEWLQTSFAGEDRHVRRIKKIDA